MDDMVLQVSVGDGECVDDALVRLEVPTFGGGEVLGQMSRWDKKRATAEQEIHDEKEKYDFISLLGDHGWKEPCCRQGRSPGQVNRLFIVNIILVTILIDIIIIPFDILAI